MWIIVLSFNFVIGDYEIVKTSETFDLTHFFGAKKKILWCNKVVCTANHYRHDVTSFIFHYSWDKPHGYLIPRTNPSNTHIIYLVEIKIKEIRFTKKNNNSGSLCSLFWRPHKVEMIFSSRRFFQKTNERIRLYYSHHL